MTHNEDLTRRAMERIARCNDSEELRRIAANAILAGNDEVAHAAQRRLYAVLPAAEPGTLEYDVWRSVHALEGALKAERKKTTLLARTRQKIARDGELVTVADLVMKPASEGYKMLLDRNMSDLTFEAVALRHPERFDPSVLESARARLQASGVTIH